MIDTRLALALEEGGLVLPCEGLIAVYAPPQVARFSTVRGPELRIIDGFKASFDAWHARGFDCAVAADGRYEAMIVCLPRSKALARALIAEAMSRTSGIVVIDGQKTDGVDSLLKEMRKRIAVSGPIAKAHGKLFWCAASDPEAFADWKAGPTLTAGGFWTAPGVFSEDAIDPASHFLASALPARLGRHVADLGAGWGFLSAHVLTRTEVEAVHLVEAQHIALECARRNVADPRAVFHWADATAWLPPEPLDAVVTNPPFHTGRAADPKLGQSFLRAAARMLKPRGALWMVANRHLPYEGVLTDCFADVSDVGGDGRFKVLHANRPKPAAG